MSSQLYLDSGEFAINNDESFDENYEDMINSYLSQRHIYSASLPLPATSDLIIEQIQTENLYKKASKDLQKLQLRQQLLELFQPQISKIQDEKRLVLSPSENSEMREIIEVTSSAEQSPSGLKATDGKNFFSFDDIDADDFAEMSIEVSQEIK